MKILFLAIAILLFLTSKSVSAAENRAGVYVLDNANNARSACVTFNEDTITALELLNRSGFNPITNKNFVIEINNSRAKNYWEQGSEDDYWSYWVLGSKKWNYARLGANQAPVANGQVDGWQRGDSTPRLPNDISFNKICPEQPKQAVVDNESKPVATTEPATNTIQSPQNSNSSSNTVNTTPLQNVVKTNIPDSKDSQTKKVTENQPSTNTIQPDETQIAGISSYNFQAIILFLVGLLIGSAGAWHLLKLSRLHK